MTHLLKEKSEGGRIGVAIGPIPANAVDEFGLKDRNGAVVMSVTPGGAASKAGLIGMSKSLAQEVASRNITVNTVAPGFISSAMTDELNDKQREAILAKVPAGRLGTSEEVAACVVFLASDAAAYVTGHTLNVNGGMLMI